MGNGSRKEIHTIDTRFTWSGNRAKEFIALAKEVYGDPLPYASIKDLIRLACSRYIEVMKKEKGGDND